MQRRQARKEKKAASRITLEVPQPGLPGGMTPAQLALKISQRNEDVVGEDAQRGEPSPPRPGEGAGGIGTRDREEVEKVLAEENVVQITDADRDKLTELDSLTGEGVSPQSSPTNIKRKLKAPCGQSVF